MADRDAGWDTPLSSAVARRVDDVCDLFEAAWKASAPGRPGPRIEEYIEGTPGPGRDVLLRHLVLIDIDYRRLRGEGPTAAEYEGRFPGACAHVPAEAFAAPVAADSPPAAGGGADDEVFRAESTVLTPEFEPRLRSRRYVLRHFHARGGIGEIWLAEDAEIGRPVALKRLRPTSEGQRDRFLVEAQITGQLEHPGIVPVHDLGVDEGGRPFYVMSFVRGRTLNEVIDEYHAGGNLTGEQRQVQFARLLEIFVQVCQAVAYAHHRGVVHRDLKPDNIMLGPFGEALVLDWGMAKVCSQPEAAREAGPVHLSRGSGSAATQHGLIMGSPSYMPPEMAQGHAADADDRTDVYLLGATLYHILTGQPPRQGRSLEEIVEVARTVSPPPARWLRADVPRALEAICLRAMATRREQRYGGARELAQDVERYRAGVPVSAYREPLLVRAGRWCKRHRRGLGRALAAALLVGLSMAGVDLVRDARERGDASRRQAEQLQGEKQARQDLTDFRRWAEEARFRAAVTNPSGKAAPYYDVRGAEAARREALAIADRLPDELSRWQPETERAKFDSDLRDFLLLTAQARLHQATDGRGAQDILHTLLERAASLRGPSRGYHRLRAQCYRLLGDNERAGEEEKRAERLPYTALDHFLEAEDCRVRAEAPNETYGEELAWRPNLDLLRQAVGHYQEALRSEPENFWCYLQMGRCYLSLDEGGRAVEALSTCIALRPNAAWGYSARGFALVLLKQYEEGERDLESALTIDPEFRPARLHRGVLFWLQRKDDDRPAFQDFTEVLKPPADRRLIEAAYYRGQLHLQRREYEEALKDFDAVVKENRDFRPVYLSRAQAHFSNNVDELGLMDLRAFLDLGRPSPLDPKDPKLFAQRGRLLTRLVPNWGLPRPDFVAKLRLTRKELETALRMGHRSVELFDDLGSVAERLGEFDAALVAYEQSLKQKGSREVAVRVRTKRGWIYADRLEEPKFDRAREEFAEAVRLDPDHADAHAGLGFVNALRKSSGEAHLEATLALRHGGDNYVVVHNVACIYTELSRVEKGQAKQLQDLAMDLLRQAVDLCRRGGDGDKEVRNIQLDSSLKVLSGRPDFMQLVGKGTGT
jgi:tetratricopeptide (TPR) repeat protein